SSPARAAASPVPDARAKTASAVSRSGVRAVVGNIWNASLGHSGRERTGTVSGGWERSVRRGDGRWVSGLEIHSTPNRNPNLTRVCFPGVGLRLGSGMEQTSGPNTHHPLLDLHRHDHHQVIAAL